MIARRDTLEQALGDIEADTLAGASTIVVNLEWWNSLSVAEQEAYRHRADKARVELRADDTLSRHFVEVRGGDERPVSTEHPM
jgi:hypothetical protein